MHCVYQGHEDIQVPLVRCSTILWWSLLVGIGELECITGTSLAEPVDSGSVLGMWVDMLWNFTFIKKWQFLNVILPEPSTDLVLAIRKDCNYFDDNVLLAVELLLYSYCITLLKRVEVMIISVILLCPPSIVLMKACLMLFVLLLFIQDVICRE